MRYFCGRIAFPIVSILLSVLLVPTLLSDIKSLLMWDDFFCFVVCMVFFLSFFFD